jgi:hypothetical protein
VRRVKRCIVFMVTGLALSLCPALILLWIYAWSMVPPGPDYYANKARFMFRMPDPGCVTWLGVFGLLPGFIVICMGIVTLFRADKREQEGNIQRTKF